MFGSARGTDASRHAQAAVLEGYSDPWSHTRCPGKSSHSWTMNPEQCHLAGRASIEWRVLEVAKEHAMACEP